MKFGGTFPVDKNSGLAQAAKVLCLRLVDAIPTGADPGLVMSSLLLLITSSAEAVGMSEDQLVDAVRMHYAINREGAHREPPTECGAV